MISFLFESNLIHLESIGKHIYIINCKNSLTFNRNIEFNEYMNK